ncbi:MAG: bifunctional indole-3-glycerol phosphate synthase/phosphoribosylanthranilate isomerase [Spirochaetales bacterium]
MNIRDTIVADRRKRLLSAGHNQGLSLPPKRPFPLVPFPSPPLVIFEIKRRSPSKGEIAPSLNPVQMAHAYREAGVEAFSVLTEEAYFGGSLYDLWTVKEAFPNATILRKDFLLDEEDVEVSFHAGADAILLIAALLEEKTIYFLYRRATALGMSVLVEVHTKEDVDKIRALQPEWVGINARNLETFRVDLLHPLKIRQFIDWKAQVVFESGIQGGEEAGYVGSTGFEGILVGESVVRDPSKAGEIRNNFCTAQQSGPQKMESPGSNPRTSSRLSVSPLEGPLEEASRGGYRSNSSFLQGKDYSEVVTGNSKEPLRFLQGEDNFKAARGGFKNRPFFWQEVARLLGKKQLLVKICGITNLDDAVIALEAGADLLGFVFAESPRKIQLPLLEKVAYLPVLKVGVVVGQEDWIEAEQAFQGGLIDALQVHGGAGMVPKGHVQGGPQPGLQLQSGVLPAQGQPQSVVPPGQGHPLQPLTNPQGIISWEESLEDRLTVYYRMPLYRAFHPRSRVELKELLPHIAGPRFLVDGAKEGMHGGTGIRVSEEVLAYFRQEEIPLWLAGGLKPETIRQIVTIWKPELVDVSSGLEASVGKKDPKKIQQFFKEIERAG